MTFHFSLRRKRTLLGTAVAFAVGAILYVFVVPPIQIHQIEAAQPKQRVLQAELVEVTNSFSKDAFTKTDTLAASDKKDIASARLTLTKAQQFLDKNKSTLTAVHPSPLLSFNDRYKQASAAAKGLQQYVNEAQKLLKDYDLFLQFAGARVQYTLDAHSGVETLNSIDSNQSVDEINRRMLQASDQLQSALDTYKNTQVAAFLADEHAADVQAHQQLIDALRGLAKGTDNGEVDTAADHLDQQEQAYVTYLHHGSQMQKDINVLQATGDNLEVAYRMLHYM